MAIEELLRSVLMILLVVSASVSDLKERKIRNNLTMPFILIGLGTQVIFDFPKGIINGLFGLSIGILIFLVPYIMKAMGAGDVKLMAALGALTGGRTVIYIALFTALAGGIIVLAYRAIEGGMFRTIQRTKNLILFYLFSIFVILIKIPSMEMQREKYRIDTSNKTADYIPYALAIASGSIITLILSRIGVIQGLSI